MKERTEISFRILSGSVLKLIAMLSMLTDHIAVVFLCRMENGITYVLPENMLLFKMMRGVGRMAFPIYSFLLVEGFLHTRDRWKYGLGLFAFALVSELPFDLAFDGAFGLSGQNVFFTLLLGYLGMCAFECYKEDRLRQAAVLLLLTGASFVLKADYGCTGFGFILLMYALRENRLLQAVTGTCLHPNRWKAGLAFIPISLYNGERGFIRGRMKYCFYAFYPVHLTVLYLIKLKTVGY